MHANSLSLFAGWRPTRRSAVERRRLPRIPLAIPIRYATEQGQVGIGVLIDVHEQGAGLLVPDLALDTFHVWLQFLWFDDRMGLQGRVAFIRETPDGFHVGLDLRHLHPKSAEFLTSLVIPYGLRKFKLDRRHTRALLHSLAPQSRDAWLQERRRRYLPVLVEQGALKTWAVTEDRSEQRAVLVTPQVLQQGALLTVTTWGRPGVRAAWVAQSEALKLSPVEMHRIVVRFEEASAARLARRRPALP